MHPSMLEILTSLNHDKVIKEEEILQHLRYNEGLNLDTRLQYLLELKDGHFAHIVFTDLDPAILHPEEDNPPSGEFLPQYHNIYSGGHLGVIFVHKGEFVQEALAHEVFHALELLAHVKDESLIPLLEDLWKRSQFPEDHYASWGGPGEGSAEVWRAHLGHYDDEEEEVLWILEDEWAEYFDRVLAHCW